MPSDPDATLSLSHSNGSPRRTRTLAIIKPHALKHRLAIEPKIIEAGFEIIKERMMQFDTDSDTDYLNELFGDDALTILGEPIWVYVLERHRAVEVWNTLMGNRDPDVARQEAPHSLRAVYGKSVHENALAGSPDNETAENQIGALFASSPPFPPIDSATGSLRSVASSILSQLKDATGNESDEGYTPSAASTAGQMKHSDPAKGKPAGFKARPAPRSTRNPESQPRMTKAAALRAGIKPTPTEKRTIGSDEGRNTFENVPGHKRSEAIKVASTAEPSIAPRLTKAASLRMGIKPAERPKLPRPMTSQETRKDVFEGVPGHKRRETISVASTQGPVVAPRTNRSALLRQQKESAAPPTSYMFKTPVAPSRPRPISVAGLSDLMEKSNMKVQTDDAETKNLKMKRRQSAVVLSTKTPTIAPRLNKSAMLRAQKEENGGLGLSRKAPAKGGAGRAEPEERTGTRTSVRAGGDKESKRRV